MNELSHEQQFEILVKRLTNAHYYLDAPERNRLFKLITQSKIIIKKEDGGKDERIN